MYHKEHPTHSRQRAPGAWREVIASPHVRTASGADSAVISVTSVVSQSVCMCGGHKAVRDSKETPRSPSPGNPDPQVSIAREPRPPSLHRQGTPDPQVSIVREPTTPSSPSPGKPQPSTRRPTTRLPAMTSTSGRISSRRSTTRHRNRRVRKPPPDSYQ